MKKISLFASAVALMAMTFVSCGQSTQSTDNEASEANKEVVATESCENCDKDCCDDCTKEKCDKQDCNKESCGDCTKESCTKAECCEKAEGGVIDLTDDSAFRPDTKVSVLTILDFNATWCVPCKKLTPAFHKAAEEYAGKVNFFNVDIDKNPETAEAFGVKSVPTVVFMSPDGKTQTYVGLNPFTGGENGSSDVDNIYANMAKLIDKAK